MDNIIFYGLLTFLLSKLDNQIIKYGFKNPYYLIHFIVNFIIVYMTYPAVLLLYTDFHNSYQYKININSIWLCMSLHVYHMIHYRKTIGFQDYLHHIPTIFLLGYPTLRGNFDNAVVGHIVFYLSGLPGGIDYLMLFCVRNKMINVMTEKFVNKYLNLYIRCPGAIISFIFLIIYYQKYEIELFYSISFISIYIFLNGVYYMERVTTDYSYNKILNII